MSDGDKLQSRSGLYGTFTYGYDAAGRTTSVTTGAGTTSLSYDDEDRLTSISGPQGSSTYAYNGADARVGKAGAGGNRTYRRDGVGVTDPVLSDGIATMVPGISERSNNVTRFSHGDRLGTNAHTSDASGNVVDSRSDDAFGLPTAASGPNVNVSQAGFSSGYGYQEDSESGLKLLGHRYYDPGTGRFITRDPLGWGLNWYRYADNNPLKHLDPEGLKSGDKYKTMDDAATAALQEYTQRSDDEEAEYAGFLYQNPDGTWSYTPALTLTPPREGSSDPRLAQKYVPEFAITHGWFHTHPFRKGASGGEFFSDTDKDFADYYHKPGYMGAGEKGLIKRYDPADIKHGAPKRSGPITLLPGNALEKDPNKQVKPIKP